MRPGVAEIDRPGISFGMTTHSSLGIDYRKHPYRIGQLFGSGAVSADDVRGNELSADQVASYRENGYLAPLRLLDDAQVQQMRDALERMIQPDYPRAEHLLGRPKLDPGKPTPMIYFQNAWLAEEAFHDILFAPKLTAPLSQLLETPNVRFWHDQIFYKPAKHGGVVAWHQDYSYWTRTEPVGHITCFLALDDTTLENGCLHVVPGSHRWPLLPTVPLTGTSADMDAIMTVLNDEQKAQFKPVPICLKAGECSFHHCLTLHGSYANRSDRPRRGVVLNFMRPDTRSNNGQKPPMPGAPLYPPGTIIEGELFPIVLDRSAVGV